MYHSIRGQVLLMTIQNPPPSLESDARKHFSKAMRDIVAKCLVKDPARRPTAAQLLEHKFFKVRALAALQRNAPPRRHEAGF